MYWINAEAARNSHTGPLQKQVLNADIMHSGKSPSSLGFNIFSYDTRLRRVMMPPPERVFMRTHPDNVNKHGDDVLTPKGLRSGD